MENQLVVVVLGMILIIVGSGLFGSGVVATIKHLDKCLPSRSQELATTCYVDEKVKEETVKEKTWQGYFYEGEHRRDCDKIDERKDEVKVRYRTGSFFFTVGWVTEEKWIPKKDFHKYHTIDELSEIVNKRR